MMRTMHVAMIACVLLAGCEKDPARSLKLNDASSGHVVDAQAGPAPVISPAAPPVTAEAGPSIASSASGAQPGSAKAGEERTPAATTAPTTTAAAAKPKPSPAIAARKVEVATAQPWRPPGCPVPREQGAGPSTLEVSGPCALTHHGRFSCESSGDDFYISTTRKGAHGATLMLYINVEKFKGPGEYKGAQVFLGVQDRTSIYRWSSDAVDVTVGPGEAYAVLPATRLDAEPVLVDCSGPMNNYQCGGRRESKVFSATSHTVSGTMQCEPPTAAR